MYSTSHPRLDSEWTVWTLSMSASVVNSQGIGILSLRIKVQAPSRTWQALALCKAQSGGRASKYPWAIVGNNITLMLADVLELKGNVFASSRRGYWGVFERRAAYFEVGIGFLKSYRGRLWCFPDVLIGREFCNATCGHGLMTS